MELYSIISWPGTLCSCGGTGCSCARYCSAVPDLSADLSEIGQFDRGVGREFLLAVTVPACRAESSSGLTVLWQWGVRCLAVWVDVSELLFDGAAVNACFVYRTGTLVGLWSEESLYDRLESLCLPSCEESAIGWDSAWVCCWPCVW